MFFTEWEVLLVDDEPDVLSVSKLAMQSFDVYGLPLKIHTAESKAEALAFLDGRPDKFSPSIAVAFVDVVMENDSAGLELCQAIREEMHNHSTQLFIRTGQPGIAPERDVIDRYDINGYFTKAEATEDKLYSLVKSGVRQFMSINWLQTSNFFINTAIGHADSRQGLEEGLARAFAQFEAMRNARRREAGSPGSSEEDMIAIASTIDGRILFTTDGLDEATATEQIARLGQLDGIPLNADGDKYIRDNENHQLIKIAARETHAELNYYFATAFQPPMNAVMVFYDGLKNVRTLWQRAS